MKPWRRVIEFIEAALTVVVLAGLPALYWFAVVLIAAKVVGVALKRGWFQ